MSRVDDILEFWFGTTPEAQWEQQRLWFAGDASFDRACTAGFLPDHERADAGLLEDWKDSARGALALVLLFDQFPRNMFRGTQRAFATDIKAVALARHSIARGFDRVLTPAARAFFYMPFMHSETLDDQLESVRQFRALAAEHGEMSGYVDYAQQHLEVIRRFGRVPSRNAILGRESTAAEIEFMARPKPANG